MRMLVVLNAALVAAVAALGVVTLRHSRAGDAPVSMGAPADDGDGLGARVEDAASLAARLRTQVAELQARVKGQAEKIRALEALEAEHEKLLKQGVAKVDPKDPLGLLIRRPTGDGREETVDVAQFVESKFNELSSAEAKHREKDQRKSLARTVAPFVKGMARQGVRDVAKRLKLDEEQTKRFQATVDTTLDTVTPAMLTVIDSEAAQPDRDHAGQQIHTAVQNAVQETQTYMNPDQFSQVQQWSQQNTQQMQSWLQMMQSMQPAAGPASQPSPGAH